MERTSPVTDQERLDQATSWAATQAAKVRGMTYQANVEMPQSLVLITARATGGQIKIQTRRYRRAPTQK